MCKFTLEVPGLFTLSDRFYFSGCSSNEDSFLILASLYYCSLLLSFPFSYNFILYFWSCQIVLSLQTINWIEYIRTIFIKFTFPKLLCIILFKLLLNISCTVSNMATHCFSTYFILIDISTLSPSRIFVKNLYKQIQQSFRVYTQNILLLKSTSD